MRSPSPARSSVTVLLAAGALAAAAQAPPTFLESLDVRVVNIEVHAVDRAGRPVAGLTARDFTVREDGRKVALTHFSHVGGATAPDSPPPAGDAGGAVLVLLDNFAVDRLGRKLVGEALGELFAGGLPEGARYALATYDGYVDLVQPFTSDTDALLAALERVAQPTSLGLVRHAERDAVLRQGLETLRDVERLMRDQAREEQAARLFSTLTRQVDSEAERQRQLVRTQVFAMSHLVNALAAVPGRKSLVYIGEGLPMQPGAELYAALDETFARYQPGGGAGAASIDMRSATLDSLDPGSRPRRDYGKLPTSGVGELAALANAGRVSFYTLATGADTGGVPAELPGDLRALWTPRFQALRRTNLTDSLRALAEQTGGLAAEGVDIAGLLAQAEADRSSYYFLGFEPDRPPDGGFHTLEVKVRGRGVKLRYRTGYIDKPLAAKLADRATASLLLGLDDNPLGLGMAAGAARPGPAAGQWRVPVTVSIPTGFLDGVVPAGSPVPAHLLVAARDGEGRTGPVQGLEVELTAGSAGGGQSSRFELLLREGPQRLAVGLVVPAAGAASFTSLELSPGAEP